MRRIRKEGICSGHPKEFVGKICSQSRARSLSSATAPGRHRQTQAVRPWVSVLAVPFLFPLLLQLALGLNALQSGLITLATAIGALSTKFVAVPLLSRFGFRTVLCVTTALASMCLGALPCSKATSRCVSAKAWRLQPNRQRPFFSIEMASLLFESHPAKSMAHP